MPAPNTFDYFSAWAACQIGRRRLFEFGLHVARRADPGAKHTSGDRVYADAGRDRFGGRVWSAAGVLHAGSNGRRFRGGVRRSGVRRGDREPGIDRDADRRGDRGDGGLRLRARYRRACGGRGGDVGRHGPRDGHARRGRRRDVPNSGAGDGDLAGNSGLDVRDQCPRHRAQYRVCAGGAAAGRRDPPARCDARSIAPRLRLLRRRMVGRPNFRDGLDRRRGPGDRLGRCHGARDRLDHPGLLLTGRARLILSTGDLMTPLPTNFDQQRGFTGLDLFPYSPGYSARRDAAGGQSAGGRRRACDASRIAGAVFRRAGSADPRAVCISKERQCGDPVRLQWTSLSSGERYHDGVLFERL